VDISAGLCRPGGLSPPEWRSCVCGLAALQALGAWPGRAEIVQACAGLRAWPGGDHECLWIPGLQGSFGDPAGLSGGSLG
jgi:hypothetical protein